MTKSRSKRVDVPCSVDECLDKARTKGYCAMHYQRYRRNGDPLIVRQGWQGKPFELKSKSSADHSYQDTCTLADIFPFIYDEDFMGQFEID